MIRKSFWSVGLLHLSLIIIAIGGVLTWLTRESGHVRILPGQTVTSFVSDKGEKYDLPTPVTLKKFEILYYPGGTVPKDYISRLSIDGREVTVSMNHIFDLDGYRLLQASYDSEGATILSVNHDPYGIMTVYTGYLLFAIAGVILQIKTLFPRIPRIRKGMAILLVLFALPASAATIDGISRETADSLRSQEVLYNGKVVCFNTLAHDFVTKIHGKPTYRGLSPEQTIMSLRLFPEAWKTQPLILIKDKEIAHALGIKGKYASLSMLFDSIGNYRVQPLYFKLPADRQRAIEELDEKVGLILSLYSGDIIVNPPADAPHLSETHVRLELLYNDIPFTTLIFILLFVSTAVSFFPLGRKTLAWIQVPALLLSLACFAIQWYLTGRIPLANTFETLQFAVIIIQILTLFTTGVTTPIALLFAGALALVAHLNQANPMVTPLMPVLHSGWLSLHVSLVMTAYAILGFTLVISVATLVSRRLRTSGTQRTQKLLVAGIYLLALGIITGSVWANVSWGSYWSWDPKETWALITLIIYAFPLHPRYFYKVFRSSGERRAICLSWYLILASLSIAMTYFGVNALSSLHAYS